ncbi:MAG: TRZ/ATZ family hydrolase [Gammaproteobacteria bacterium]
MEDIDTLVNARWIIPVEPHGAVLHRHALAMDAGRIVALLPQDEARRRFRARESADLDEHALVPGLVNAHTHAAMSLFRGFADDRPLMQWLTEHIWPAEQAWVTPDFVRDGARLACAEMLKSGTTCFSDMYFHPDVAAEVAVEAGIRAVIGLIVIGFPSRWAASVDEYLGKGLAVHDRFRDAPLISTAFAPHAPYTVDDAALERVRILADELDVPIVTHVHETAQEIADAIAATGARPLRRLQGLGLLSPRLCAVHMTQVCDADLDLLARYGCSVVHCPESNMKLASGFCPAQRLLDAGINLAIGTDGAASNNDLDMFSEMRSAALLAKAVAGDPTALPAPAALHAATLGGARALGLDQRIGSLLPGKQADMVAVRLAGLHAEPVYDPLSQLVYCAGRGDVADVWVGGVRRVRSGALVDIDERTTLARARAWAERIRPHAGA